MGEPERCSDVSAPASAGSPIKKHPFPGPVECMPAAHILLRAMTLYLQQILDTCKAYYLIAFCGIMLLHAMRECSTTICVVSGATQSAIGKSPISLLESVGCLSACLGYGLRAAFGFADVWCSRQVG